MPVRNASREGLAMLKLVMIGVGVAAMVAGAAMAGPFEKGFAAAGRGDQVN